MKIQLIRHATLLLYINNKKILVDPVLSPAGKMESIPTMRNKNKNPLVELPIDINELLDIDGILLTHVHEDHFDATAKEMIPKNIPIFCQSEDLEKIQKEGFTCVNPIEKDIIWNDITLIRTKGQHGSGEIGKKMGTVSGFVIKSENEPSIYITGDTIWCPEVESSLEIYNPDIVISFAGCAQFDVGGPITMAANDIYNVYKKSPNSKIIAVHMEAWNHCTLSKNDLENFIKEKNISNQVYIPHDGELMIYNKNQ